jgi:hypothetical protein
MAGQPHGAIEYLGRLKQLIWEGLSYSREALSTADERARELEDEILHPEGPPSHVERRTKG